MFDVECVSDCSGPGLTRAKSGVVKYGKTWWSSRIVKLEAFVGRLSLWNIVWWKWKRKMLS